ncbi:MAG TPA: SIR2 family protein, partial [Allosphingosinicella sp.]|nr:SIR2 family protein [Allosphingosinicella sp.]
MIEEYVSIAKGYAEEHERLNAIALERDAIRRMEKFAASDVRFDKRVALSVVKEALTAIDRVPPSPDKSRVDRLEAEAARIFGHRGRRDPNIRSTVAALKDHLGIRRYATLNYDLELEMALMAEPYEWTDTDQPLNVMKRLQREGKIRVSPRVRHKLSRLMTNGRMVESDIRDRERPDRMIDFAVGSAEVDERIMHLHGRACTPGTMIVGLRDYDRLYRRDDLAKLPFEHGQRILFAGNPILFVGVGMTEPEVNATLQTFVSNNPYRRFAPTFLLWNTTEFSADEQERKDEIAVKRIDFLQRLGIFTLFDEDLLDGDDFHSTLNRAREEHHRIEAMEASDRKTRDQAALRDSKLDLLAASVQMLSKTANAVHDDLNFEATTWRSMRKRLANDKRRSPVTIWGIIKKPEKPAIAEDKLRSLRYPEGRPFRAIIGPPGTGKGSLGWRLANQKHSFPPFDMPYSRRLLINAGFAFDTDSLLIAVSQFILKLKGDRDWAAGPDEGREKQFAAPGAFKIGRSGVLGIGGRKRAMIIINGMERFFTVAGAPLSAELDHLLRRVAGMSAVDSDIVWCFLGPERTRKYFEAIGAPTIADVSEIIGPGPDEDQEGTLSSLYLATLLRNFDREVASRSEETRTLTVAAEATLKKHSAGEPEALRRATFAGLLDPGTLDRAGVKDVGLALEILRAMAFIGAPVEDVVLLHAPGVRKALDSGGTCAGAPDRGRRLREGLKALESLELVIELMGFEEYPVSDTRQNMWRRYGLHPSLSSELRHQFGVPLSESKLSTAFNMSLYVAQPVDGYVPEPAIHDELAQLIDFLIGVHKDDNQPFEEAELSRLPGWEAILTEAARSFMPAIPEAAISPARLARLVAPVAAASLRAALAVVRGYYSTTSLLTIDRGDRLASEDRDGVMLEHAERLERLVRAHTKLSRFREALLSRAGKDGFPSAEAVREVIGPEPFYPDDLVWMHNELAVVCLAQGDLYAARSALSRARQVNRKVEANSRSHNWRRITINQIFLDIERAHITGAERKLSEVERSINERPVLSAGDSGLKPEPGRFARIRRRWGKKGGPDVSCFHPDIMHEELLMTALVLGYRGVCHHIRGHLLSAEPLYQDALAILRRLGEHRAYANFQRHYAQLHSELYPLDHDSVEMRLAVAAAESVRQMDMAYYARIIQAASTSSKNTADTLERRKALQQLNDAFSYSALMDLHRLRI